MNKSTLFTNAWNIARNAAAKFGGNVKSYFSESLKMAYRAVSEITVDRLVELGGSVWIKDAMHRVYFNVRELLEFAGLELDYYKTGNIKSAKLDGSDISNGKAAKIRSELAMSKFWFDVKENKFKSNSFMSDAMFDKIASNIK